MSKRIRPMVLLVLSLALALLPTGWVGAQEEVVDPLAGTEWLLASWGALDARTPVSDEVSITLSFGQDGTLSGSAGCNRYQGAYELAEGKLSVGPVASTMRMCDDAVMAEEDRFLAALDASSGYELGQGRLRLFYEEGQAALDLLPAPVEQADPLVGSEWILLSWGTLEERNAVTEGVTITLAFGPEGTVVGSAGCNRYNGSYTLTNGPLAIPGPLAVTGMACPEPVMAEETRFLAALGAVSGYELRPDGLRLFYEDDQGVLEFGPAPQEAGGEVYVVQPGDWLTRIATAFYGDPSYYEDIVAATNAKAAEDERFQVIDDPAQIEVGQLLWLPRQAEAKAPPDPFLEVLRATTFPSEYAPGGRAKLSAGEYREAAAPGSATQVVVTLGQVARGDLNSDGVEDAALVLISDPGGSGTFRELWAVLSVGGAPVPVTRAFLGDRVQVQSLSVSGGVIVVEMLAHGPDDPMCCPTQELVLRYTLQLVAPSHG